MYTTITMIYCLVSSTFLTFLQKFSYHNLYAMFELAETTQTSVPCSTSYSHASGTWLYCYKIKVFNTKMLWSSSWKRESLLCIDLHHVHEFSHVNFTRESHKFRLMCILYAASCVFCCVRLIYFLTHLHWKKNFLCPLLQLVGQY